MKKQNGKTIEIVRESSNLNNVGAGFHPCPKQKHIKKLTSNNVGARCFVPNKKYKDINRSHCMCPKTKTYNKPMSNVVGIDCIDPQNHCNNKMGTCNAPLQRFKQNSAITLIALIITIIVLLILAGVTLNMVMGDSGIFSKAQLAKENTNKSQALEELKVKVLDINSNKNGEAKLVDVIEALNQEGIQTETSENSVNVTYKNYKFCIDDNLVVSFLGEESKKEDAIILYPNASGTSDATEPSTIGLNQRWTIPNPYPGKEIYCRAELKFDTDGDGVADTWNYTTGFTYNGGGCGVTASHVKSDTEDYIAIQTGSLLLASYGYDIGLGLEGMYLSTAEVRVVVAPLKSENTKIIYPNASGTSDSTEPSTIGLSQRWTISNPYPGKEIYCRSELKFDTDGDGVPDTWNSTTGFTYSGGGYGTTASHVKSDTDDYIAIQAGSNALNSIPADTGLGVNCAGINTALVRVIVSYISDSNVRILYPNAEGTNTSTEPNFISVNQRFTIENPFKGSKIYCEAELKFDTDGDGVLDTWNSANDFVYNSGGGYGTTASHVKSNSEDYIAIRSGLNGVCSYSTDTGLGIPNIGVLTNSPLRLKVYKMD